MGHEALYGSGGPTQLKIEESLDGIGEFESRTGRTYSLQLFKFLRVYSFKANKIAITPIIKEIAKHPIARLLYCSVMPLFACISVSISPYD